MARSPLEPMEQVGPAPKPPMTNVPTGVSGEDMEVLAGDFERVRRALASQPKVRIRTQKDEQVWINGYGFNIKGKEWVEVPEQVAQILEEADRL